MQRYLNYIRVGTLEIFFCMKTNLAKNSIPPKNRRRLASEKGCKTDLDYELPRMFMAWKEALEKYEHEVVQTKPEARARGFEASLLNSKMIEAMQKYFPINWKFAKYKRFMVRVNGYIVFFKKLDKHDRPMNIKTKQVDAISQQLALPLFDSDSTVEEPILFFGYRKNRLGVIHDPKLVYIDEQKVQWTITENDIDMSKAGKPTLTINSDMPKETVEPRVKKTATKKKSS